MTHLAQNQDAISTRYRYRTHQNLQLEIPERLKTTRTHDQKPDTHLCITIPWVCRTFRGEGTSGVG